MNQLTPNANAEPFVAETVPELFAERVRRSPDAIAYAEFDRKRGAWIESSWSQAQHQVERWRRALAASDVAPGERVALLQGNSLRWVYFDQAALSLGLATVPLFSTDSPENWAHILSDSEPSFLLIGKAEDWVRLKPLRSKFPSVKTVVCGSDEPTVERDLIPLRDWLDQGVDAPDVDIAPDTLATITYSSGTTGRPKGVMLSHRNLISATQAALARNHICETDVFLTLLPMAHVFARTVEYYLAMICGGRLVFARSVAELSDDFSFVRPTILISVPRIYERACSRIESTSRASAMGAFLFDAAVRLYPVKDRSIIHRFVSQAATNIIKKRVLASFGGRLQLAVSGSAPLSTELALALRAVGIPLIEGYGMAEAGGPVSGDPVSDYEPGTVGSPLKNIEARLSEQGELLIRSPSVMLGYWNRAEETKKAIDENGWLHTGDLAQWVGQRIKIIGRVHDLIVTATGEKLAPSDVEFRITSDPLFDQAVVVGNNRPYVTALVVLDRSKWIQLASADQLAPTNPDNRDAEKVLLKRISALTSDMPSYAQVRRLHATLEPWTAETGLATVTMKLKRPRIEEHYRDVIDRLYEKSR